MILTIDDEIIKLLHEMGASVDRLLHEGKFIDAKEMSDRRNVFAANEVFKKMSKGEAV